jgi:hypothetical protein
MNMKKLIIKDKKAKFLNENFTFDQIKDVFGFKEITATLSDVLKVVSANIKYAIEFVLSFRSLSIKKIHQNMKQADAKFARRVRNAMRSIDRTSESLSSGSYINEAFLFAAPEYAIVDNFRKSVDDAGGMRYFLQSEDQNLYVGNLVDDVYSFFEKGTEKLVEKDFWKDSESSSSESSSSEIQNKKNKNLDNELEKINNMIRESYGLRALNAIRDLQADRVSNKDAMNLKVILENNRNLTKESQAKKITAYFEGMKNNIGSNQLRKDISIIENKLVISNNKILIKENKKNASSAYKNLIAFISNDIYKSNLDDILSILNPVESFSSDMLSKRLKEDVKEYEDLIGFLCIDCLVMLLSKEYEQNKTNKFEKSFQIIEKIVDKISQDKVKNDLNSGINKINKYLENAKEEELIPTIICLLKEIDKNNPNINKEYIAKLNKFSNSKDQDFIELKSSFKKLYKIYQDTNITSLVENLQKLIKEKAENSK